MHRGGRQQIVIPEASDFVTLLIVNNQPVYRAGVKHTFSTADAAILVVGEAADCCCDTLRMVEDLALTARAPTGNRAHFPGAFGASSPVGSCVCEHVPSALPRSCSGQYRRGQTAVHG
jgi:hypothetical protein